MVVVNFRSSHHLAECLRTLPGREVVRWVVVVNNSPWDEADAARLRELGAADPRLVLVDSPGNVGFGAGVNTGVAVAARKGASIVWILNPDVRVASGATEELVEALRRRRPAIVTPLITSDFNGQTLIAFAGGRIDLRTGRVEHERYRSGLDRVPSGERRTDFITGAAMMLEVSTFAQLGGFREDLFLYWEDVDLSLRAQRLGIDLVVVPAARVWHLQGGSAESRYDYVHYYTQRNRIVVAWTIGQRGPLRLVLGEGLPETLRLIARPVVRDRGHRVRKTWRSVRGIFAGVAAVRRLKRTADGTVSAQEERGVCPDDSATRPAWGHHRDA
ncbi:glycosyltransferase [Geodermatophilus sp. CPCC 205761]|uniref:glycosyltransferase n=1 Tax=Geodermatophilus sp. CPCC 205761 TaxID=2936597 RepID=UPI003EECCBAA